LNSNQYKLLDEFETKPINEIKPTRWIKIDEQLRFIEFLNHVGLNEFVVGKKSKNNYDNSMSLYDCASIVEKYKCTADSSHSVHVKYRMCGKRGICPRCSKAYAHKRAMIMYLWLKSNLALNLNFDLKMNQIVLTLPIELQDMNRKLFVKIVKEMMNQMRIESYGYVIQEDHSDNPLSSSYLHAHILTLNMREIDGRMAQNDYFFDLDVMRLKWKSIIKKFSGVTIDGDVNLNTQYASVLNDPSRVLHMLAYCYRYPIEDLFNVQIRKQSRDYTRTSILSYVQTQQNESEPQLGLNILQIDIANKIRKMVKTKPRVVWCGWLTSAKRGKLKELMKEPEEPEILWNNMKYFEEKLDERARLCRDCGQPLHDKPFEISMYVGDNEPNNFQNS
jgi:hypothetical protein